MDVLRFGVEIIEKAAAVFACKDAGEAPWVVLQRLDVLDLDDQDVAGFCALDLKRAGEIVDACQIDILDIVGGVVVPNLTTRPVYAFDLYDLAFLDLATEGDCEHLVNGSIPAQAEWAPYCQDAIYSLHMVSFLSSNVMVW